MGAALVAEGALVTVAVEAEAEGALAGAEVALAGAEVAGEASEAEDEEEEEAEVEEEVAGSSLVATGVVVGEQKGETSQGRM